MNILKIAAYCIGVDLLKKVRTEYFILIVIIAAIYITGMAFGITCPILMLTGISCPGCGMTRAWVCALHGDIAGAFGWHPLFLLPVVLAALYLLRRHIPETVMDRILKGLLILTAAVWIVRFFIPGDPAVHFRPFSGLILRSILQ